MKKWVHESNRQFPNEEVQKASKYMKNYSTSLAVKEMPIKTTLRFQLSPVRMVIFKAITTTNAGEDVAQQGNLIHCWWECKIVQPLWKVIWRFLKSEDRTAI
jgi:hypothetical protein